MILKVIEFCKTLRLSAPEIQKLKVPTLTEKFQHLKTDEFVGDEYVSNLIKLAKNRANLGIVKEYLESERSSNLPINVTKRLIRSVNSKIKEMDKQELMERLLEKAKNLDHIDDLF
jgi:hypothetical protein